MTAPTRTDDRPAEVVELAISKACREELHLWCKGKAGQHGRRLCGCGCHDVGRPMKTKETV
jgi:hypothetical protein